VVQAHFDLGLMADAQLELVDQGLVVGFVGLADQFVG
jgi:hypothetical protein